MYTVLALTVMAETHQIRTYVGLHAAVRQQAYTMCPLEQVQREDDRDDWRIRCRYFHSLGMDQQLAHHDHPGPSRNIHRGNKSVDDFNYMPETTATLKGDHGQEDPCATESIGQVIHPIKISSKEPKRFQQRFNSHPKLGGDHHHEACASSQSKVVSFCPSVLVRSIPGAAMYSERIRRTMWMTQREYAESICRNAIEFMAEGCEPEHVLDESDFIERDGRLVHPVCLLLDEPENARLKRMYSVAKPKTPSKGRQGLRRHKLQELINTRMHTI